MDSSNSRLLAYYWHLYIAITAFSQNISCQLFYNAHMVSIFQSNLDYSIVWPIFYISHEKLEELQHVYIQNRFPTLFPTSKGVPDSFVKIPCALKTQPWNSVDGGVLAHFLLLAEAIYPSAKPLCHVVSPPQLSQSSSQPQAHWCLISLHIPIDCHHHPWAKFLFIQASGGSTTIFQQPDSLP